MKAFQWMSISLALMAASPVDAEINDPAAVSKALVNEIRQNGQAYNDLRELTDMGHRLSGSDNAARAVAWAKAKLESYGFDSVTLQPMQAPRWERGNSESATLHSTSANQDLKIAALGGSIGTSPEGIEASVIEVSGISDVERLGDKVRGKIVFYNRPMDPNLRDTFDAYSGAVDQRTSGPSAAAKFGAVGVLVRTLTTLTDDDHPHTGITRYSGTMIPAAAISTHGANILSQALKNDTNATVHMQLSAQRFPAVTSYNVIGEYRGSSLPHEYVVVGGHLDSWDLGQGAHDDGAGVVQSIEVVRAMKAIQLRPSRTIRVVLFMSEEFGGIGGVEYAKRVRQLGEKHVAAIESDRGGFAPRGFSGNAPATLLAKIHSWMPLLGLANAGWYENGEGGTDIDPLAELGVPCFGYVPDSTHYFDFHHASTDRFEAINKDDLHEGAAAMAILTYLLADQQD